VRDSSWHNWDLSLGPVAGVAGSVTTVSVSPQCLYRVSKAMAYDTGSPPGTGTRIMQFLVGNRIQRPTAQGSTLSAFFGPLALGNRLCWDTCQRGLLISITVSFVQACTFDVTVFGEAI